MEDPENPGEYLGKAPQYNSAYAGLITAQLTTGGAKTFAFPLENGSFTLSLPGYNGERWRVWASFEAGDSDTIQIQRPIVSATPAEIYFHYQGATLYKPLNPTLKWLPETGYPAHSTVRLTASHSGTTDPVDTTLGIVISDQTSTGIGTATSEHTAPGGNGSPQIETATVSGTVQTTGLAKITLKSDFVTGPAGAPLVIPFPVNAGDVPHIVASRAIAALNASEALAGYYTASSTGALNQIAIINPYPGACSLRITFPTQPLPDIVKETATEPFYDLYPSGYLTTPIPDSAVPPLFKVIVTHFDGRQATSTFLRSSHTPSS